MTTGSTLRLSDGPNEALVALVVQKVEEKVDNFLGRTSIQKLCYFAKELGVPFSYGFAIYHYGPYSEDLASSLDLMRAEHVLQDRSPDTSRYSNFRVGERANELLSKYESLVGEWEKRVESVAIAFGQFRPEDLELMATLRFVHQRLKAASGGGSPSKQRVLEEFSNEKPDKFEESVVQAAYDRLAAAGLV